MTFCVSSFCSSDASFTFAGADMVADPTGALWWPGERALLVADLHLEKASSLARIGTFLPPYDTRTTLARLAAAIARWNPARVVALGDSFHDPEAMDRIGPEDRSTLSALMVGREWNWIAGNHETKRRCHEDGEPLMAMQAVLELSGIRLTHESGTGSAPEISGHYHPSASVRIHGRRVTRRCFVTDGRTMIMPAFGCYTGGLDIRDPAVAGRFPGGFTAFLLGQSVVLRLPSAAIFGTA